MFRREALVGARKAEINYQQGSDHPMEVALVQPELTGDWLPERCPHCSSKRFNRHGWFGWTQRYRCKECRRTFSMATKRLDQGIRLRLEFRVFLAGFDRPAPVRADAEFIGVSATTVWRWRHRILAYLYELGKSNPKMMDGRIAVLTRSMSNQRSRWSSETDLLWRRRGAPLPREAPKQRRNLTFVFAARYDAADVPPATPFLCTVYEGFRSEEELGDALLPHLLPSARVLGPQSFRTQSLVGRRMPVREHIAKSPLAELYAIERIPPDLECVGWEEIDLSDTPPKMRPFVIMEARSWPARLQSWFAGWMRRFRAVRLHYVARYVEWFNRLLDLEIAGKTGPYASLLWP